MLVKIDNIQIQFNQTLHVRFQVMIGKNLRMKRKEKSQLGKN